jgi:hypothetical protein
VAQAREVHSLKRLLVEAAAQAGLERVTLCL